MKTTLVIEPPLGQIAAALRRITETLARELVVPGAEAPAWTEFEWRIARAVAAMHGVSSLLYKRLRWEGPPGWRRFLADQQVHSAKRHSQIMDLVTRIDAIGRREGLAVVALKGAALHALGIYAAGERPMGDIDLLVQAEDLESTAHMLESLGYGKAYLSRRHQTFQPMEKTSAHEIRLGEHIDSPIKIEVHSKVAEQLPRADITRHLFPSAPCGGVNPYPSLATLMLHLLLHAAGNMRARALRLIQLHDIALLAKRFASGDWDELLAAFRGEQDLWWALAPLTMTERYYSGTIPSKVLAQTAAACPWLFATLTRRQQLADLSWSNIRIAAFPGIEWTRTMREAVGLVVGRIWPNRQALSELKDGAAQIPGVSSIPWYGISHAARIVRWVFLKAPRVQTMLSVQAALEQDS